MQAHINTYIYVVVQLAKAKYAGLRTYWVKQYKMVVKSSTSGSGTNEVFKPTWAYYEDLMFLKPTVTVNPTESSIERPLRPESQSVCYIM